MLFHSPIFLYVFLPVTLVGFLLLEHRAAAGRAIGFLVLASFVFYAWYNPLYLPLLLGSILFNYGLGRLLAPERGFVGRYALLVVGIAANLAMLGAFKYADFAVRTLNWLGDLTLPELGILLPIAISFFTFQQVAYLVDAYQGHATKRSFRAYALFVNFFPHLIAGPIVHHREMMTQFEPLLAGKRRGNEEIWTDLSVGFTFFTIGLVKKVLFADQFASWADTAFGAAEAGVPLTLIEAWLGTACFTLQIYLDFSAYSDMAIGLARLFGIRLPINFNSPYKATSIIDFWRRWHITLSRFLRDYLYVPLGGNRLGPWRRHINIMIVMVLGGFWHGAAWTFVAWGALHGIYLVINHGYRALAHRYAFGLHPLLAGTLTLLAVMVAWVFFRAESFGSAVVMLKGLGGLNGVAMPLHWEPMFGGLAETAKGLGLSFAPVTAYHGSDQVLMVAAAFLLMWLLPNSQEVMREWEPALSNVRPPGGLAARLAWRPSVFSGAALAGAALLSSFYVIQGRPGEFIYFQF